MSNRQTNPLVSVIIPCYNVEAYISECLNAIYNQSYRPIEVIAIDNNSSDNTLHLLEKFRNEVNKDLVVLKEIKKGAPAARNRGLKTSKGRIIQFLDADDLLLPEKIEHQIDYIFSKSQQLEKFNFLVGGMIKRTVNQQDSIIKPHPDIVQGLFLNQAGNTSTNLFNRDFLEKVRGWDETLKSSQEYDLMFRLLQRSDHILIDESPLTVVRERVEGQISQSNPAPRFERIIQLLLRIVDYLRKEKISYFEKHKKTLLQRVFDYIRTLANHDLEKSVTYYHKLKAFHFKPSVSRISTKSYLFIYYLLGFKRAELFKRYLQGKN